MADITLSNGESIVAHVPNTGSMTTCWEKGWTVYVSQSNNPKRKLAYTLELTDNGHSLISVNTSVTNKIVKEALINQEIPEFEGYTDIFPERKINDSRLDFYLEGHSKMNTFIEVKNVTLIGKNSEALFPDSKSVRGQKHLLELINLKKKGYRTVMFYLVNRMDVDSFSPAKLIDPTYYLYLKDAVNNGVEVLAYQTNITTHEITISKRLEVIID